MSLSKVWCLTFWSLVATSCTTKFNIKIPHSAHVTYVLFMVSLNIINWQIFRCVCEILKSDYQLCHVCLHGTTWLPLDRFLWNCIFKYFSKPVQKIQVSLKSDKNVDTLHENLCIFIMSCWIIVKVRNVLDKCCRENKNVHFMFNNDLLNLLR